MGASLKKGVGFVLNFSRILNWLPTLQSNLVMAFLLLLTKPFDNSNISLFVLFAFFQIFILLYTFVVNDVGDAEIDIKAGKIRDIQRFSLVKQVLILILLSALSLFIPMYLGGFYVQLTSVITFLLLSFYSLKPLRFKEHGLSGLIVASGAQRSLLLLVYGLLISASFTQLLFSMVWLFIIGFQDELGHQLDDFYNDKKASAHTWVQGTGYKKGRLVLSIFITISLFYPLLSFLFFNYLMAFMILVVLYLFRLPVLINLYVRLILHNQEGN